MRLPLRAALPLMAAAVAACDLTDPSYREIVLEPEVASAGFDAEASFAELLIDLRIENTGLEPVEYLSCSSQVERFVDGAWHSIWTHACALSSGTEEPVTIRPGEVLSDRIEVRRGVGGNTGWSLPLDGPYRVVAGLVSRDFDIPEAARRSSPFPVRFR